MNLGIKSQPTLNTHNDECLVKCPYFSSLYILFVICLWTCLLRRVQTTHESTCVNFSTQNKIAESRATFHKFCQRMALVFHKILEKLSRNNFFLKFHVRIWTEFRTIRDKFHVKRMSINLGKRSNNFTHKRTFLSILAVMNTKFIENLVS